MKDLLIYLQNAVSVAFLLLGATVVIDWARRRDSTNGFLALALGLLSFVAVSGRVPALLHFTPPFMTQLSIVAFLGSSYALFRFRGSFIPIDPRWHAAVVIAMVAAGAAFVVVGLIGQSGTTAQVRQGAGIAIVVVWSGIVLEAIVRFWLVARGLPAVQGWRLRSLSLGFAGVVAILIFAVLAGAVAANPAAQVIIQLAILVSVPLLYVSLLPPAWLRRQWRSTEEEGLRNVMQDLLVLDQDREVLIERALEWAMRLVGASAVVALNADGVAVVSRGLDPEELSAICDQSDRVHPGDGHIALRGSEWATLTLPLNVLAGRANRLVLVAGPFTPRIGAEESSRVHQFVSALAAAFDRLNLIQELREVNDQLQEASRAKSVFLANMSHELRTPLNAILGFSELLIDAREDQFDKSAQVRFLSQIHSSGKHLLGLINEILDLSKVEAGQMDLRLETVRVPTVVDEAISTIEPLAATKRIRLEVDAGAAGEMLVDAGKLKQMLLNLLSNAVKFTPENGKVSITAVRTDKAIEISVADNGIGIAEADMPRIFQEFQQLDSGAGRQVQGTGLGLALTRRFALLHGGDVRLASQVGKGSVFTLTLPIVGPPPEEAAGARPVSAEDRIMDAKRPLVLIVEDNPLAADLVRRTVERGGFRSVIARTGTEALAKARELHPMAVTLDILLPELDGWEVLTRLKHDETTSDIPVVIISIVDNPELGIALGALDYFVKPVAAPALLKRLSKFNFQRTVGREEMRILVVDDEPANREWLAEVLKPAGYTVIEAVGGREAIELARSGRPDLILLDLMMPGVTGFDVVAALRAETATRATPIMVLTAKNLTEDDKRQLNGQVSTILSRGSTAGADLLGHLQEVVARRSDAR